MDGLILVHKPPRITSHDVVDRVRKILNEKKVGHFGTLDPLATGLLQIAVGKTTRLFPYFSTADKKYKGRIKLGFSTDTYDSQGKPTSEEIKKFPAVENLEKAMKQFEGEILQKPPPYSAKKFKGKPLYELARKNKEINLAPNKLTVHYFRLIDYNPPFITFKAKCSAGTYIRSLAHDLGAKLECGAHLSELTRIESGGYSIEDCVSLEEIEEFFQKGHINKFLIPMEALLPDFPKIILKESGSARARNGGTIFSNDITKVFPDTKAIESTPLKKEEIFRLFSPEGNFIALAKKTPGKNGLHPFLVIEKK